MGNNPCVHRKIKQPSQTVCEQTMGTSIYLV